MSQSVTLRPAGSADELALRRLAALDSARAPHGETLVAERDGALIAAVSADGRTAIADPFVPTAGVVALLRALSGTLRVAA